MNRFSNRVVRDLAWVIASPPLVSGDHNDTHWWNHNDCLNEFNDCLPALEKLDKDPVPLITHLTLLNSKRLGLHFESFVAYWLMISPNYDLIAQNIQIMEALAKGSHTLGEIDFIIRNLKTDEVIHLEVAVKFYLGSPPYDNPMRWFGTNTKDQLGKKVNHLKQHQTQLSTKYPEYISNLGYRIDKKACFLKGRLFYPMGNDVSPEGVPNNHLRGRWIQGSNTSDENNKSENKLLYPLEKLEWLAQFNHNDFSSKNLENGFRKEERAKCYIQTTKTKQEIERVFYLPESFKFPD